MRLALVLTSSLGLSLASLVACSEQAPAELSVPTEAAAAEPAVEAAASALKDANTLTPEAISAMMVGEFESADDANSTIAIDVGGKWTETYEGTEPVVSAWRVFAGDTPPAGTAETFTPASRYLEVTGENGAFYYELGQIGHDGFDMFYKPRGNRLSYERVKAPG